MPARRFPPPWFVEQQEACFFVRDHNGQALTYIYYEDEPRRRSAAELVGLISSTRAIDHLLYEIASTRPPPKRHLGLGQPSSVIP